MNRSGLNRLSQRCGAIMLLALGVCLVHAPAESRAGCIHPSFILRGNGTTGASFFQMLPETGAMAAGVVDLTAPPAPKKSPCSEGRCSKAPVAPLAPPTTITLGVDELAALEHAPITTTPGGSPLTLDPPLDLTDGPSLSIFHPPRLLPAPGHPALGTAS